MKIRPLEIKDRELIKIILEETKVFHQEEIVVAIELIDIYLNNKEQKDYELFSCVDDSDKVLGYTCTGPTPMTEGTYDLYWIAVSPASHGKGIGKYLLSFIENKIKKDGGRLIIAETSSRDDYENTRQFYIHADYTEVSRIKDYYRVKDDLVVYGKYL
jgi:ribosomal protein S18 acetylase RimI-like enzyme